MPLAARVGEAQRGDRAAVVGRPQAERVADGLLVPDDLRAQRREAAAREDEVDALRERGRRVAQVVRVAAGEAGVRRRIGETGAQEHPVDRRRASRP